MHEMSIAEGIVDIALDTLRQNNGSIVHAIQVKVGRLSGVEPEALQFCFEAVTRDTAAAKARLEIELVPVTGKCLSCDKAFTVEQFSFKCPVCQSSEIQMITGRELKVVSIDMD